MMKNVRLSRRGGGTNPREGHGITDVSGLRGTGTVTTKAGKSDLPIPKKASPFGHEDPMTGVPKGRALPIRGEGPTVNNGPTVGKNGIK
jgi:hypothetical protein